MFCWSSRIPSSGIIRPHSITTVTFVLPRVASGPTLKSMVSVLAIHKIESMAFLGKTWKFEQISVSDVDGLF